MIGKIRAEQCQWLLEHEFLFCLRLRLALHGPDQGAPTSVCAEPVVDEKDVAAGADIGVGAPVGDGVVHVGDDGGFDVVI